MSCKIAYDERVCPRCGHVGGEPVAIWDIQCPQCKNIWSLVDWDAEDWDRESGLITED